MIPIYEQSGGKSLGYTVNTFSKRFEEVCKEHLAQKRAKAFAFIFYDFDDKEFRKVLEDDGVFAKLDRLSGEDLSIFYLHSAGRTMVERFNAGFITRLGLNQSKLQLPCVVFFRFRNEQVTDIAATPLESANLIHGLSELQAVIDSYRVASSCTQHTTLQYLRWIPSTLKFITLEVFRVMVSELISPK